MAVTPSFLPLIPTLPSHKLVSDNGDIHPAWNAYFMQMTTILQQLLSKEGVNVPKQTNENINYLSSKNSHQSEGSFLYDKDEGVMKVNHLIQYNNPPTREFKQVYTRPEQLTSAQIAAIPVSQINGTWVFDTDTNKLKYGINDVFKEVAYT